MTPKELIEAVRNRPVTKASIKALEERCRKREAEFARIEKRTRNFDYNFKYTI